MLNNAETDPIYTRFCHFCTVGLGYTQRYKLNVVMARFVVTMGPMNKVDTASSNNLSVSRSFAETAIDPDVAVERKATEMPRIESALASAVLVKTRSLVSWTGLQELDTSDQQAADKRVSDAGAGRKNPGPRR